MSAGKNATPAPTVVEFHCCGKAVGKMRNELAVSMVRPFRENFSLASDEGAFHGGEATAPPPLALFAGGLTGCIMTQIRAFAKRLDVELNGLEVNARIEWLWQPKDQVYETEPRSFELDIDIDSPASLEQVTELIQAAKKGCFIEQTLARENTIRHRVKTRDGWLAV